MSADVEAYGWEQTAGVWRAPDHPVVRLLDLTADARNPAVISARELAVDALEHLRLVATSVPDVPRPHLTTRSTP